MTDTYVNPWLYNGKLFESKDIGTHVGFVYCITNLESGKKYIGKKLFWSAKKRISKNKTIRMRVESDWKKYWGSSDYLLEDVKSLGKDKFKREIFRLCNTKGECSYYELKEQLGCDSLLSDDYYNTFVGARIHKKHVI